jgi:hypothetical protein
MNRRCFIAAGLACMARSSSAPAEPSRDLSMVPQGRWVKIHEQAETDALRFRRQAHAGAAFDARRGRLVVFGSDGHGEDWKNSPFFFDPVARIWTRLYPHDDPATYRTDRDGIPVAGVNGNHPWAMHTMGAVVYHAALDALVVSSFPAHLEPGRFTDAMAHVWPAIRRHPTWLLDMKGGFWTPLAAEAEHFFPYATAYDPERQVVIGYKAAGVFELGGEPLRWKKVLGPGLFGYHDNTVFDTRQHALVVFGTNANSNDVVSYEPATRRHRRMPTPGLRPPAGQARPMAFHPGVGQTVVLCDRRPPEKSPTDEGWSETWLYDLGRDAWSRHDATLPFPLGMNYNLVFDPGHDLLLLVTGGTGRVTAVWALRL